MGRLLSDWNNEAQIGGELPQNFNKMCHAVYGMPGLRMFSILTV
jgi:hypothetical protein